MPKPTKINWINPAWVDSRRTSLALTVPTLADGSVNEFYTAAVAELEAAEAQLKLREEFTAAAIAAGYRLAKYDGKCCKTGDAVKAGCGFIKKNDMGRWLTYSINAVLDAINFESVE